MYWDRNCTVWRHLDFLNSHWAVAAVDEDLELVV